MRGWNAARPRAGAGADLDDATVVGVQKRQVFEAQPPPPPKVTEYEGVPWLRGGVRPVKVRQRSSGGCWRTLEGLADFAVAHSYLSTAAKWGIDALDALTQLFTTGPWLPAAIRPG